MAAPLLSLPRDDMSVSAEFSSSLPSSGGTLSIVELAISVAFEVIATTAGAIVGCRVGFRVGCRVGNTVGVFVGFPVDRRVDANHGKSNSEINDVSSSEQSV